MSAGQPMGVELPESAEPIVAAALRNLVTAGFRIIRDGVEYTDVVMFGPDGPAGSFEPPASPVTQSIRSVIAAHGVEPGVVQSVMRELAPILVGAEIEADRRGFERARGMLGPAPATD